MGKELFVFVDLGYLIIFVEFLWFFIFSVNYFVYVSWGVVFMVFVGSFYFIMRGFIIFFFYVFFIVNSGIFLGDILKEDYYIFEVWNDGNVEKRLELSSFSLFYVKVEEYE